MSKLLADAGAAVAINYVSNEQATRDTMDAIAAAGGRANVVQGDVARGADIDRIVAEVEGALGPVDVLVAHAGAGKRLPIEETTETDFVDTLQNNLTSAFLCSQAVLPGMRERKGAA